MAPAAPHAAGVCGGPDVRRPAGAARAGRPEHRQQPAVSGGGQGQCADGAGQQQQHGRRPHRRGQGQQQRRKQERDRAQRDPLDDRHLPQPPQHGFDELPAQHACQFVHPRLALRHQLRPCPLRPGLDRQPGQRHEEAFPHGQPFGRRWGVHVLQRRAAVLRQQQPRHCLLLLGDGQRLEQLRRRQRLGQLPLLHQQGRLVQHAADLGQHCVRSGQRLDRLLVRWRLLVHRQRLRPGHHRLRPLHELAGCRPDLVPQQLAGARLPACAAGRAGFDPGRHHQDQAGLQRAGQPRGLHQQRHPERRPDAH